MAVSRYTRRHGVRAFATLGLALLTFTSIAPGIAGAVALYGASEGNGAPFKGTRTSATTATTKSPYTITLKKTTTSYTKSSGIVPSSMQAFADGSVLFADAVGNEVAIYKGGSRTATIVNASLDPTLSAPASARSIGNGEYLIADRNSNRVIIWDKDTNSVVWQYGGAPGTGVNQLTTPNSASYYVDPKSKTQYVLIADVDAGRVIQVKRRDYDPTAANNGFSSSSITWKAEKGTYLSSPTSAQRIDSKTVAVTDKARQLLVVYTNNSPAWYFGSNGNAGSELTRLSSPTSVQYVKGAYFVTDAGNKRVLRITTSKVATVVGTGSSLDLASYTTGGGRTYVGETGQYRSSYFTTSEQRYQTKTLDLGTPGIAKWITRFTVTGTAPTNTKMWATYSINGGAWKKLGALDKQWPKGLKATTLRARVYLDTSDEAISPTLTQLSVNYTLVDPMTPENNGSGLNLTSPGLGSLGTSFTSPFGMPSGTTTASAFSSETVAAVDPFAPTTPAVLSGSVMKNVRGGTAASRKASSLTVEPAGFVAATLLLGTVFALGAFWGPIGGAAHTVGASAQGLVARTPKP